MSIFCDEIKVPSYCCPFYFLFLSQGPAQLINSKYSAYFPGFSSSPSEELSQAGSFLLPFLIPMISPLSSFLERQAD